MLNKLLMSAALVAASSTAGFAQGFSGAELGIEYSDVSGVDDLGGISYYGSAEFELLYGFSAAVDFSLYNFEVNDDNLSNLTGHLTYRVNNVTDVGLFFGQDYTDGTSSSLFGAELSYDFGFGDIQGYVGSAEDPFSRDITLYGAGVDYDFGNGFGFEANLDRFTGDSFSASAFEIGGYYDLPQGPRLGATIGTFDQDATTDESETYFALKASIAVGSYDRTTFGPRGVYEAVRTNVDPGS